MTQPDRFVMILWAAKFDELPASLFVALLRDAGVRVKLVGLTSGRAAGSHGLGLVPDLTIEEALPLCASASCVVIPCGPVALRRLSWDPRVRELLRMARANHALVVVSAGSDAVLVDTGLVPVSSGRLMTYHSDGDLFDFAGDLASLLSPASISSRR